MDDTGAHAWAGKQDSMDACMQQEHMHDGSLDSCSAELRKPSHQAARGWVWLSALSLLFVFQLADKAAHRPEVNGVWCHFHGLRRTRLTSFTSLSAEWDLAPLILPSEWAGATVGGGLWCRGRRLMGLVHAT